MELSPHNCPSSRKYISCITALIPRFAELHLLIHQSRLQALDLNDNMLTGSIPPELGSLSQLTSLLLGESILLTNCV